MKNKLYIFSGLPGTGKTTLAKAIAKDMGATYFRIDTIEQALRDVCKINVEGEGYRLTYWIAEDNLRLGNNVVIDCVNPVELTRKEWEGVAIQSNVEFVNIEIKCSDKREHRKRSEQRENDIAGFELPKWEDIEARGYEEWNEERIEIETSGKSVEECVEELKTEIIKLS
ncbi:MAG TPA: AAA family ATPase [Thermoflexales bacterium]|nr:AAA family ATPase [Thermoflexales bacterium]HQW35266.1 AAA family ATPase [Thermoflexales bacterium]